MTCSFDEANPCLAGLEPLVMPSGFAHLSEVSCFFKNATPPGDSEIFTLSGSHMRMCVCRRSFRSLMPAFTSSVAVHTSIVGMLVNSVDKEANHLLGCELEAARPYVNTQVSTKGAVTSSSGSKCWPGSTAGTSTAGTSTARQVLSS
jgi:hypothetical protein